MTYSGELGLVIHIILESNTWADPGWFEQKDFAHFFFFAGFFIIFFLQN